MSEKVDQLKMLRDLTNNNEIKMLINILLDIMADSKEPLGFKSGEKNGKRS